MDNGEAIDTSEVLDGDMPEHAAPEKAGYIFAGWNPFIVKATADAAYTAMFVESPPVGNEKVMVSFNTMFGSYVESQLLDKGEKAVKPSDPSKAGYSFEGWFADADCSTAFDFDSPVDANTVVFAGWTEDPAVTHTVTWNMDDGTMIDTTQVEDGGCPVHSDPEKEGYIFTGWTPAFSAVTEDTTYTAKFYKLPEEKPERVALSFNTVYGSYVDTQVVNKGEKAAKPSADPDKEGCTFDGWYTDNSYSTEFDFDAAISEETVAVAKWLTAPVVTHKVTWQMDDGTLIDETDVPEGETPSHDDPVKEGCVFTGWDPALAPCTADATYKATFRAKSDDEVTVSFETNGGSAVQTQTVKKGEKAEKPADPTKSGYTFDNWYTDNTFAVVFGFNTAITADTTLYAKWTEVPVPPVSYEIIEGANSTWTKGSKDGQLFTSNAEFAKFKEVKVDGTTIAATNYTAEEGSTKITLAPTYLETLSVGSHSIVVVSTDGSASTNFTVKSAAIPPVPTTYTVTFNMNGHGTQITAQTVKEGEKASKPADPTASGYTFGGWYADATCSSHPMYHETVLPELHRQKP